MRPDRRRILTLLSSLPLLGLAPALARAEETPQILRIGSASTAGTYFPIAGLIATAISSPPGSRLCASGGSCGVPGLIAVAQSTEGSAYNVRAVQDGTLDTAFSQADVAWWAFRGQGPFADQPPMDKLRTITSLYPEYMHLMVRGGSGIRRIQDLKGKRISIDREGSGTQIEARLILEAFGLSEANVDLRSLSPEIAIEQIRHGEIDGFFLCAAAGTLSLVDLARSMAVSLVPIVGPEIEPLLERYPFIRSGIIDPGTYPLVPGAATIRVWAQWLVSADIEDELVEAITAALWHPNTQKILAAGHPEGRAISLETALEGLAVPLHPGAAAYYRSIGLLSEDGEGNAEGRDEPQEKPARQPKPAQDQ